jgi:hypothetical protein
MHSLRVEARSESDGQHGVVVAALAAPLVV